MPGEARSPPGAQRSLAFQAPRAGARILGCSEIRHIFVQLESAYQCKLPTCSVAWPSCVGPASDRRSSQ